MKHGVEKMGNAMKHGVEKRAGGVYKHGMGGTGKMEESAPMKLKCGGAVANTANPDFGKTNMNTMVGTERKGKK